uniref:Uncharacterized protein n=1 Tax=Anopheles merus TaxID=30066 RepID=A0A182V8A1_ANOME
MTLSDGSSNELFSIGCWSSAFEAAFRKNGIASVIERTIALATPLSGTTVSACFRSSGAVGSAFRCSLATSDGWGLTVPFGITSRNSSTSPLTAFVSSSSELLLLLLPLSSPSSSTTSKSSSGLPTSATPSTSWCSFTIFPSYRLVIVTDALSLCTSHRLSNCSTTSPTFTYHSFTVTSRMPSPMSDR